MEENEEDYSWIEDEWNSPSFQHGIDVGESLGAYKAVTEAQRAYEVGEIELWLDYHRARSMEEWEAWEEENGPVSEFSKRWQEES